jgi:hypothetical protein
MRPLNRKERGSSDVFPVHDAASDETHERGQRRCVRNPRASGDFSSAAGARLPGERPQDCDLDSGGEEIVEGGGE